MRTAGIICEFNPFHSGHAFLIRKARELGADRVVCLMSGDYVQRGEPAIWDRHVRARMALLCGADLVLSYPTRYAVSSAESFGEMAVRILASLGVVDLLVFGSESGDLKKLTECAELLALEPGWYRDLLRKELKKGVSFPRARAAALPECAALLGNPNDILGIEYLKAMIRTGASFAAVPVKREGSGHRGLEIGSSGGSGGFPSGAAVRRALAGRPGELPEAAFPPILLSRIREQMTAGGSIFPDDYSAILLEKLWKWDRPEPFTEYEEVSVELAGTLLRERPYYSTWDAFVQRCSSKSFTMTRVSRALLHLVLELRRLGKEERPCYARVLGLRAASSDLLAAIAANHTGELVMNPAADAAKLTPSSHLLFGEELRVSNLYEALRAGKTGQKAVHELSRPMIRITEDELQHFCEKNTDDTKSVL